MDEDLIHESQGVHGIAELEFSLHKCLGNSVVTREVSAGLSQIVSRFIPASSLRTQHSEVPDRQRAEVVLFANLLEELLCAIHEFGLLPIPPGTVDGSQQYPMRRCPIHHTQSKTYVARERHFVLFRKDVHEAQDGGDGIGSILGQEHGRRIVFQRDAHVSQGLVAQVQILHGFRF